MLFFYYNFFSDSELAMRGFNFRENIKAQSFKPRADIFLNYKAFFGLSKKKKTELKYNCSFSKIIQLHRLS